MGFPMVTFLGIAIRVSAGLVRETKWHEPRLDMPNTVRGGSRSRNGVTLIEMGVVVAIVLVLLALLVATLLGVYKPQGMTSYGWQKQDEKRAALPE